jgi:predicted ATPase
MSSLEERGSLGTHRFPAQTTSFVGRRNELAELTTLVPEQRLLTLTGPGGTGKTRLACAVAGRLSDRFADGAWFVDLAALTEGGSVPTVVASALDIASTSSDVHASLLDGLARDERLIVLDNCEHLLSACADLVADLLAACPSVTIIATSREELGVSGEAVWGVPAMLIPSVSIDLDELMTYDAVRLLTERATMANRTFVVSPTNAAGVVHVIERLDGIPLAVELAAAWTRVLTPDEIASRLDDRFALLTRSPSDAPARHRTLRAAIDWSYELLSEPERQVLGTISVFRGGFTLEAAEGMCVGDDTVADVLGALHGLVDGNLVAADTSGEETRYSMLETIREYANETLSDDRRHVLRDRHLAWFASFAERGNAPISGETDELWHLRFDRDHDNIRHALRWSLEEGAPRRGLELANFTSGYWVLRSNLVEARSWIEQLIGVAQEDVDARPAPEDDDRRVLAGGYHELARIAMTTSDYAAAGTALPKAAELLQGIRQPTRDTSRLHAAVLDGLAQLSMAAGDLDDARTLCERSVAILRSIGERLNEARALTVLGDIHVKQGDFDGGCALVQQGMDLSREVGDLVGVANATIVLGNIFVGAGDLAGAARTFERALALCRDVASPGGVAYAWSQLGRIAADEGDLPRAIALTEKAKAQYLDLGLSAMGADMALWIGSFALRDGALEDAAASYLRALELDAERVGPWALEGLAEVAGTAGEAETAGLLLGAASVVRETSHRLADASDLEMIGRAKELVTARAGQEALGQAYAQGRVSSFVEALEVARRLAAGVAEGSRSRPGPSFLLEGEVWVVSFEGRSVRVGDAKGIRHIARLVSVPGREIHVLDLVAGPSHERQAASGESPLPGRLGSDAGELLDAEARGAYESRLRELEEEIEEAETFNDEGRATRLRAESDALVEELKRATGLGGRSRKAASESERARLNVQRTIKAAIKRLFDADHALGRHLDEAVKTGTYCSYVP